MMNVLERNKFWVEGEIPSTKAEEIEIIHSLFGGKRLETLNIDGVFEFSVCNVTHREIGLINALGTTIHITANNDDLQQISEMNEFDWGD